MKKLFLLFFFVAPIIINAQTESKQQVLKTGLEGASIKGRAVQYNGYPQYDGYPWDYPAKASLYYNYIEDGYLLQETYLDNGYFELSGINIGIDEHNLTSGKAYPNPSGDNIIFPFNLNAASTIETQIINSQGQTVIKHVPVKFNSGENNININLSNLPSGNYIAKFIMDNSEVQVIKFVKSNHGAVATESQNTNNHKSSITETEYFLLISGPYMESLIISGSDLYLVPNQTLDLGTIYAEEIQLEVSVLGSVKNQDNNPVNGFIAAIYEDQQMITHDTIHDGNYNLTNIPLGGNTISHPSNYSLVIYNGLFEVFTSDSLLFESESMIMDTIQINNEVIISGKVYDLNSKWSETGERLPTQGIQGKKVYLKSNPDDYVLTDANGMFELILDSMPEMMVDSTFQGTLPPSKQWRVQVIDSLFVEELNPNDTTHYFFKTPIGHRAWSEKVSNGEILVDNSWNQINYGTNIITAFNDTTGIAMFERYVDLENGVDMLEHLKYVANIENKFVDQPYWEHITTRMKDEDLVGGLKVYMNRDIAPNEWYADSAWAGIKASEAGRFKFQETNNIDEAFLVMKYTNNMVGQEGTTSGGEDEFGVYLSEVWINIRGPQGGPVLEPGRTTYVCVHEPLHIAYSGGIHSQYIEDVFYNDATERWGQNIPLPPTTREVKGIETLYNLERNPKLKQWFK